MATSLPAASSFTGSTVTEAQFKTAITDLRTYLAGLFSTDGEIQTALETLGGPYNSIVGKDVDYTVLSSDKGNVIRYFGTNSRTLTTPSAATVGSGFGFCVVNASSQDLTIDGNGSETVDGSATITLEPDESAWIMCNASAWFSVLRSSVFTQPAGSLFNRQSTTTTTNQASTTSWVNYISDTITVESGNAIVAWGDISFYTDTDGHEVRLVIDGTQSDLYLPGQVYTPSDTREGSIALLGVKTGLSSGSKTVSIQIKESNTSDLFTATDGSLILFEEQA